MEGDEKVSREEMLFLQVVSMFQVAALQHMGKIPSPLDDKIERDMVQAKMTVDILGMLKEKTKGNLSKREEEFLNKAVFESQMNYVDELKRSERENEKQGEDGEATNETQSKKETHQEPTGEKDASPGTEDGEDDQR